MRRWGLACAAAAALIAVVPAAASHPAKSADADVTLTAFTTAGSKLVQFVYAITGEPTCDGLPVCYPNYGKPFNISLSVKAPSGGPAFRGIPSLVSAPAGCFAATQPVVLCDSGKRDNDDPSAALPLSGSFTVKGLWAKDSTAAIVVTGYSLHPIIREGVPMPPPCTPESDAVDRLFARAQADRDDLARALHEMQEHLGRQTYLRDTDQLLQPWFWIAAENLRNQALRAKANFRAHAKELERAQAALDACEKGKVARMFSAAAGECTVAQWRKLTDASNVFRPRDLRPLGKKLSAEQKAKKHNAFRRDLKRLFAILRAELKQIKALEKALKTCT